VFLLTPASIIEATIAGYAGVVSTLSLIVARRAYRAGGPVVDIDWEYFADKQELILMIINKGRADVTVSDLELTIERHRIFNRLGNSFNMEITTLADIQRKQWCAGQKVIFPLRLASNSMRSIKVKRDVIHLLPPQIPSDEIFLKFTARTPHGKQVVWVPDTILQHFTASDPDTPIMPGGWLPT
jgi:hypothetical protein